MGIRLERGKNAEFERHEVCDSFALVSKGLGI